jgi:internalin A
MQKTIPALLLCFLLALPVFAQDDAQTPYEIALQRIEEARSSGAISLDLSGLGLTELPSEIGNLTQLLSLSLVENELSELPSSIGTLINLQRLDLRYNLLSNLPDEFANLQKVIELYLSDNEFYELPPQIGGLKTLRDLLLNQNHLSSLNPEIAQLSGLRFLSLSGNQLSDLPAEFSSLDELCWLDISYNQFRHLPTLLGEMESLQGTCIGIYRQYPSEIILDNNPLISPPPEVIAEGTPAILDYLRNEAWWHLQRLIAGGASSVGIVAAIVLGLLWKNHRRKGKKRGN